jgi:altronate dehydratase small subunit
MVRRKANAVVLSERDNVAVALDDIEQNTLVRVRKGDQILEVRADEDIPFAHKFAITNVQKGHPIYKYGEIIGKATRAIRRGQHVHVHNVEGMRGKANSWKTGRRR